MPAIRHIPVFKASGGPRDRGLAVGKLRTAEIRACVDDWLDTLAKTGVADIQGYLRRFLDDTNFLPSIRAHTPDLLDEVSGIIEGSGVPEHLLLSAQFMDEEWLYRIENGHAAPRDKCSSVAARTDDGVQIIGQNMDLGGYTDGHQVAYLFGGDAGAPSQLIYSISSMIGLMGTNSSGLAVCVNAIPQISPAKEGLPVAFVMRALLARRNLDEATAFLRSVKHATSQHYLIADYDGARSIEAGPELMIDVTGMWPTPAIAHTNHLLAAEWQQLAPWHDNSVARLASLTKRTETGRHDLAWAKAALASTDDPENPVSRTPAPRMAANSITGMISFTTGSIVSVLDPGSATIDCWLTQGPPSQFEYSKISLDRTDRDVKNL